MGTVAYDLIKKFEGCSLKAYPDPATGGTPWTIGYGSTMDKNGKPFKKGDIITQSEAEALLVRDINKIQNELQKDAKLAKLSENAIDAIISLCYNVGIGSFKRSKCYKAIIENDLETVCRQWDWFKANGKFMKGLARRRIAELGEFLNNV
ncbi:MAG: lysozyme [Bacteroidales bacterium]|nr:lysozyme [Bacteroidales bacterium]